MMPAPQPAPSKRNHHLVVIIIIIGLLSPLFRSNSGFMIDAYCYHIGKRSPSTTFSMIPSSLFKSSSSSSSSSARCRSIVGDNNNTPPPLIIGSDILPQSSWEHIHVLTQASKLSDKEILSFMRDGHIQKCNLLSPELLSTVIAPEVKLLYERNELMAWRHKVKAHLGQDQTEEYLTVEECRAKLADVEDIIPFLQLFNLWYGSDRIRQLALSEELGHIAAQLLGVKAVRLYQDSLFVKRSGDGPTLWHSDLNMAPFDSNDFVTCWIPLQPIPSQNEGGSSLSFASGSHRDFALPFWSDPNEYDLSDRYEVIVDYVRFDVGDVSWHHGWTLHSAPANDLPETRYAYALSYVADGARLLNSEGHLRYPDKEDEQSYAQWIDEVGWGGFADHPLLPLIYVEPEEEEDE